MRVPALSQIPVISKLVPAIKALVSVSTCIEYALIDVVVGVQVAIAIRMVFISLISGCPVLRGIVPRGTQEPHT